MTEDQDLKPTLEEGLSRHKYSFFRKNENGEFTIIQGNEAGLGKYFLDIEKEMGV